MLRLCLAQANGIRTDSLHELLNQIKCLRFWTVWILWGIYFFIPQRQHDYCFFCFKWQWTTYFYLAICQLIFRCLGQFFDFLRCVKSTFYLFITSFWRLCRLFQLFLSIFFIFSFWFFYVCFVSVIAKTLPPKLFIFQKKRTKFLLSFIHVRCGLSFKINKYINYFF